MSLDSPFTLPSTKQFLDEELPEVKHERGDEGARSEVLTEENALKILHEDDPDALVMSRSLLGRGNSRRLGGLKEGTRSKGQKESPWHDIPVARMTPELGRDLKLLEGRKHVDLKRFYKSSGRKKGDLPTRVHIGTVVESAHEFYSGRLKKRDRYETWMGELIADKEFLKTTKRRYLRIQEEKGPGRRFIDNNLRGATKRKRRRG